MGTPGVTDLPVLDAVFDTPTNNRDGVDGVEVTSGVLVDTTSVVIQILRNSNGAGNGTTLVDFLHHVLLTRQVTVLVGLVDIVVLGNVTSLTRVAVSAALHGGADLAVVVTSGSVDRASLISNLVLRHPLEGFVVRTTMATIILHLARDENLGSDVDIGPSSVSGNLDTIRHSRGGGVSPAGTTVLGNVLVSQVGQVVDAVNVIPKPLLRQSIDVLEGLSNILLNRSNGTSLTRHARVNVSKFLFIGVDCACEHSSGENDSHSNIN
mmetsp:Transcript_48609/g.66033  ORF Transcript_48609/g.66033 Transcript_48609/m.66033 type:complete len:266 (-) Transcript_48609:18-815(-)